MNAVPPEMLSHPKFSLATSLARQEDKRRKLWWIWWKSFPVFQWLMEGVSLLSTRLFHWLSYLRVTDAWYNARRNSKEHGQPEGPWLSLFFSLTSIHHLYRHSPSLPDRCTHSFSSHHSHSQQTHPTHLLTIILEWKKESNKLCEAYGQWQF